MYEHLTKYRCLVLAAKSDSAPVLARAAMVAGLCVLVTRACGADLGNEEFIRHLSDDSLLDADLLVSEIAAACAVNDRRRSDIVDYALSRWDYALLVPKYLDAISSFRSHFGT
jgi:hypothetical protein